jgi:hypothetical protein
VAADLLAEEDFAGCADVLSSLCGTFVGTCLKADNSLSGLQLLFREVTLAFVGRFGS